MLTLQIAKTELFNASTNEFYDIPATELHLEHCLKSLDKWESKYKKPFLSTEKTEEELRDYIRFMTLDENVNPMVYLLLTEEHILQIKNYMEDMPTATTFRENKRHSGTYVSSEQIYSWMAMCQIPFECDTWHLNKLMTLIRACNNNAEPKKKMSSNDIYSQQRELNRLRRLKYGSKG